MALADDEVGAVGGQVGVELRTDASLDAMVGPEDLWAVGHLGHVERGLAGMLGREGGMARRVPVLGQDDGLGLGHQRVDAGDDQVALGDGERAAGAEIVLHVDDDQGVCHGILLAVGSCVPQALAR